MHGLLLVGIVVSVATAHAKLASTPKLIETKGTRSGTEVGTDGNGKELTSSDRISLTDYVLPAPYGPNHGTSTDPKRVLCDASLIGQLCQVCPDHIVCLGGAHDNIPPIVIATCCNKPGCTSRFIAAYTCSAV